jgi:hypothetical protein
MLQKYVATIQYTYPKEAVLYIALFDDSDVVSELTKFIINTKNYNLLLEPDDLRVTPLTFVGDLIVSNLFGEKLYHKLCHAIAEHLNKTNTSLDEAMNLYNKIGMEKEVIKIWLRKEMEVLENIDPVEFFNEKQKQMVDKLKTVQEKYPLLYENYERNGVFEKFPKQMEALEFLGWFTKFYNLAFQGRYESCIQVIFNNHIVYHVLQSITYKY